MIVGPVIIGIGATIAAGCGSFKYYQWARVHPKPGLIILGSVFTVLAIIGIAGFHWFLEIVFILLAVASCCPLVERKVTSKVLDSGSLLVHTG